MGRGDGRADWKAAQGAHRSCVRRRLQSGRNRLLTTSEDNSILIWDLRTATPIGEPLTGHEDGVIAASYTNDGLSIISTSTDGTARIRRLAPVYVAGRAIGVF